ncbi:transcriptional corepressor LEUNIG_HOMOLOG-like isoform X2 [Syzygium oleosum]|uniref:transcriptional corepressor LEUNIG_HOMOLOG-like isoform X2 n=1 Tax=Syzygium oleosum TaxID=219896 RepID=UPI0011D2BB9B|nr:transcriptional corepressor LEUNIG_HOMOLOG-like isoform X2 [Syzygium oleosum]
MARSNWEADKMLDVYIHDYMLKRKLHASAKAFMTEGKVATDPVAIDAPGGFLFEWWSVFWDIFIARTNVKHSDAAAAYIEQLKGREQQQLQVQQLQLLQQRNAQLQRRDPNHPTLGGSLNNVNPEVVMGQPSPSMLAMKMYGERMNHPHGMDLETSPAVIDANRMAHIKAATDRQGQLIQANPVNMPSSLQQTPPQPALATDVKSEINPGATQKSLAADPSSIYGQAILQSKSGLVPSGLNQGLTGLPLKGWPLTGLDQIRPNIGGQMQKSAQPNQNQFLLTSQQQQPLAQPQAQSSLGNPNTLSDVDSRRFGGLPRGGSNGKDNQSTKNDGSSSPKNRKRKQNSSSGAANSTGTGPCPSPNSPPSTHTPGDGVNTASSLRCTNGAAKSMTIHATAGSGGPASSTNLLEDVERFGDVGSLDDNVESLLSHESGDGSNIYGTAKQSPPERQKESSKSFTFGEVGCIRTRNSKITCCHFSSDGKLLASAGHDNKVVIWNMNTLQTVSMPEEHKSVITDIRFRPNSSQLATASFDKSVRLWDATQPNFCLDAYTSHSSPVMSLDFHPRKTDLLCFCDNDNEIRYWSINPFSCTRISKGGTQLVRFQPRVGQLLAAASDKVVTIFDVETDRPMHSLQGHPDLVNYISWDASGECLASVSQNLVKIWSLTREECIRELSSIENQFHSCVFHPTYPNLLVIGGFSSLELWNIAENKRLTVRAHENIISALAQSPATGMVASASHDCSVKIWK